MKWESDRSINPSRFRTPATTLNELARQSRVGIDIDEPALPVRDDPNHFVQMTTSFGGRRNVDWLSGEQLPRIC